MRRQRPTTNRKPSPQGTRKTETSRHEKSLAHGERKPSQLHAPPELPFTHWLSLEQIRKMQRMRRQAVLQAMEAGELPYERRGRIRYARLSDVLAWEEQRLARTSSVSTRSIHPDLQDLAG